jgi:hypothetical protein
LSGILKGEDHSEDVDERIILKWILKLVWNGLIWRRKGTVTVSSGHRHEIPGSIKGEELFG